MWAQAQFRSDQLVREILEAGDATALGLTVLRGALLAGDALAAHVLDGAANTFAFAMRGALPRDQTRLFHQQRPARRGCRPPGSGCGQSFAGSTGARARSAAPVPWPVPVLRCGRVDLPVRRLRPSPAADQSARQ
jgi:hypothetical protein